jgi:DNA-directed RNA polymerase subunit RPC12/RpoP
VGESPWEFESPLRHHRRQERCRAPQYRRISISPFSPTSGATPTICAASATSSNRLTPTVERLRSFSSTVRSPRTRSSRLWSGSCGTVRMSSPSWKRRKSSDPRRLRSSILRGARVSPNRYTEKGVTNYGAGPISRRCGDTLVPPLILTIRCEHCGREFDTGIRMAQRNFARATFAANYHVCPECGHRGSYRKEDYRLAPAPAGARGGSAPSG